MLELEAMAYLPYMWFAKMVQAHSEFMEALIQDMGA
jgi:hypothetical protein